MKRQLLRLSLGLALLGGAFDAAHAGGWTYGPGGIRDYGTSVPVPAPVPIPIYEPAWYFRGDVTVGVGNAPDVNEEGFTIGNLTTREFANIKSDFEGQITVGAGVGYYWSPTFRTDFTAETRAEGKVKINGTVGATTIDDETTVRGGIFLFNGYYDYDMGPGNPWKPYVGLGLGFSWSELKRNHFVNNTSAAQEKTHTVALAAQTTVGAAYRLTDWTHLDLNYRFLYLRGNDAAGLDFAGNPSRVEIGDQYEHKFRAGIRIDVN